MITDGPYIIAPGNPFVVRSIPVGIDVCMALPIPGSRTQRRVNARLFAASWDYHRLIQRIGLIGLNASLYGSNPEFREAVNEALEIHRIVEGN